MFTMPQLTCYHLHKDAMHGLAHTDPHRPVLCAGGLSGTVMEIPTGVHRRTLLSDELLGPSADTPRPERKCGSLSSLPPTPASATVLIQAQKGGSTLSVNKHLMSICYMPDTLLGENKTNANLFLEVFGSQNTYVPPSLGF